MVDDSYFHQHVHVPTMDQHLKEPAIWGWVFPYTAYLTQPMAKLQTFD